MIQKKGKVIFVSACLLGLRCRYDGKSKGINPSLFDGYSIIPVCPEVAAGLGVPRNRINLSTDFKKVLMEPDKRDITVTMLSGIEEILKSIKQWGVEFGVLKEGSPSCGVNKTYTILGKTNGSGIFASILKKQGFKIMSEEDFIKKGGRNAF